jgi:chromosome partitioning protein
LSGIDTDADTLTMQDVLMRDTDVKKAILPIKKAKDDWTFDIVPATVDMVGLSHTAKISKMKKTIASLRDSYDFIFLDVNPSPDWRHALTLSVLDGVCIVMKPDILSLEANRGIFDSIEEVQESTNQDLKVLGFVLNYYDSRTRLGSSVAKKAEQMAEYYDTKVFDTAVRGAVAMSESALYRVGVTEYAPKSTVADDVRSLTDEIIKAVA